MRQVLRRSGFSQATSTSLPPVCISTVVQVVNQPIVRGTITIQDPRCTHPNLGSALIAIYRERGAQGVWPARRGHCEEIRSQLE